MKVIVVYVCPLIGGNHYLELAARFLETYHKHPAGFPHESLVVCNGAHPDEETRFMFEVMENPRFMYHDNSGYDCGAYQHAARENPCDLMVFFGASSYLKGPGWLARMVQAWTRHGDTLYGTTANRGFGHVQPHIRTTGFFLSTGLLNNYPHLITRTDQRYNFEHSQASLTSWVKSQGLIPWLVYWDRELKERNWDDGPDGYHQGQQSNLLCGDRMTRPPFHPVA